MPEAVSARRKRRRREGRASDSIRGGMACGLAAVGLVFLLGAMYAGGGVREASGLVALVSVGGFLVVTAAGLSFGVAGLRGKRRAKMVSAAGVASHVLLAAVFGMYVWWPTPSSLILAAGRGDLTTVERALILGVSVNSLALPGPGSERRTTALIAAAEQGQEEVVRVLLAQGADVQLRDSNNNTALFGATTYGNVRVVRELLGQGANPDATVGNVAPLSKAAENGNVEVVKELLSHGAQVNPAVGVSPLLLASEGGHLRLIQALLEHGADLTAMDEEGNTALHLAAARGHSFAVGVLLTRRPAIDALNRYDETPLAMAVQNDRRDVVTRLLSAGAKVDVFSAIGLGDLKRVEEIVDSEWLLLTKTRRDHTPLHEAVRWNQLEVARFLLDVGAPIDARTAAGVGLTPLHLAVLGSQTEMVRLLLGYGADPNLTFSDKGTVAPPLYFAVMLGKQLIVRALLNFGAEVNAYCDTEEMDGPPLLFAVHQGDRSIVEELIRNHADVSRQHSVRSPTPLHEAIERGDRELVEVLLMARADVNRTAMGFTPLEYAQARMHRDAIKYERICELLQGAGAKQ